MVSKINKPVCVLEVRCPACKAGSGEHCKNDDGTIRAGYHVRRYRVKKIARSSAK